MNKEIQKIEEREYIIPLRKNCKKVPRYKKANKAIRTIKEFLVRHMKVRDRDLNKIRIDKYLNEFVWARGIRKPPVKVKVRAFKEGEIVRVELSELPEKLKFKKLRLERKEQKLGETSKKKKEAEEVKKPGEAEEEKKKEAEEKKSAVVETGKKEAKETAKKTKHQTKLQKQPKHQKRMALQK